MAYDMAYMFNLVVSDLGVIWCDSHELKAANRKWSAIGRKGLKFESRAYK